MKHLANEARLITVIILQYNWLDESWSSSYQICNYMKDLVLVQVAHYTPQQPALGQLLYRLQEIVVNLCGQLLFITIQEGK